MSQETAYYLRKLEKRGNWVKYCGDSDYHNLPWIKFENDFPSDVLSKELRAFENELSLFYIDSHLSNLERVLAAIGATRQSINFIDYSLIPIKVLNKRRFNIIKSPGCTPDNIINEEYHWNFIEITGLQLAKFAKIILDNGNFKRVLPQKIKKLIIDSYNSGHLEKSDIDTNIYNKIVDSSN